MPERLSDPHTLWLFGAVLALLVLGTAIGQALRLRAGAAGPGPGVVQLNQRIRSWWTMVAVFAAATVAGPVFNLVMFGLVSFLALREFITLTPTRAGDHRALAWTFFVILPLQYWWIGTGWYSMFSIFIPVYAFLFIPARAVLAGDTQDFLARMGRIQWGLMVCVYCVSHAPALLTLEIPGYAGNAKLLFFLVCVVQLGDVFQYVWGKAFGRRRLAPTVSPNKTVEGAVGGVLSGAGVGAALAWATPFTPLAAAAIGASVCVLGILGDLTMSAIKRDRGVKDFSAAIAGHGGVMDRIDSLCFAAPVFFHVVRYWYTP